MSDDKARAALYAYATVAFREDGVPTLVHNHVTQMLDDYRDEARANQQAAAYGVVFDRPDADRNYAWGPFAGFDTAARFAEFVEAEIDPARVIPWAEATTLPGVRVLDAVTELLTWRTSIALTQRAALAEEFAAALLAVDPVEWALAGQHAGADAARLIRRMADAATPTSKEQ